jgi:hypothetical protein
VGSDLVSQMYGVVEAPEADRNLTWSQLNLRKILPSPGHNQKP